MSWVSYTKFKSIFDSLRTKFTSNEIVIANSTKTRGAHLKTGDNSGTITISPMLEDGVTPATLLVTDSEVNNATKLSAGTLSYVKNVGKSNEDYTSLSLVGGVVTVVGKDGARKRITKVGHPVFDSDATTKEYVDTNVGYKVDKKGDTMSGILDMGSNKITNVADPVDDGDAVNNSTLLKYLTTDKRTILAKDITVNSDYFSSVYSTAEFQFRSNINTFIGTNNEPYFVGMIGIDFYYVLINLKGTSSTLQKGITYDLFSFKLDGVFEENSQKYQRVISAPHLGGIMVNHQEEVTRDFTPAEIFLDFKSESSTGLEPTMTVKIIPSADIYLDNSTASYLMINNSAFDEMLNTSNKPCLSPFFISTL